MRNTTLIGGNERDAMSIPLSLGEILGRIERRLAWYGLPESGVRALEAHRTGPLVVTLEVAGNGVFREEVDPWTGMVQHRAPTHHDPAAG